MNAFFVIKRDGSRIGFDLQRITNAIRKAASAVNIVDEIYIHDLSQRINTEIFSHYQHEIDINQIQKIVEDHLMTSKYPQIARAYIEYRHDRDLAREKRSQLTKEIEANVDVGKINVELRRDGKTRTSKLELVKDGEIYKTGLYVKDSITGTGTLTYIDPETKIFGALGHEIIESNTNSIVEVKDGSIFRNYITGIDKSKVGYAGSKNAKFYYNTKYGTINKNTNVGIYGIYDSILPNKEKLEVAGKSEIKIGKASIATVLSKEEIKYYDIEITKIDEYAKIKNISFKITDKELLDKTGGVVQGMSGSPIMQNGKIIGAVTHVIIDNPTIGYGLFITTMLDEGEK